MPKRRVVFAPDAFKGSASALDAARALAAGWRSVEPDDEAVLLPMADGGEGTLDTIASAHPGSERVGISVVGPDGGAVGTSWLRLPDGGAVVELASTSGLLLTGVSAATGEREFDPLAVHTFGTGMAMRAAIEGGASRIYVALGGSASSDGGAGLLRALGARLLDRNGAELSGSNASLAHLESVDLGSLVTLPPGGIVAWTDVRSPLLGKHGAVSVFGPQKGIDGTLAPRAEANLRRLAETLGAPPDVPGAGAAGGAGFGLHAIGADIESGAEAVANMIGLDRAAQEADLLITGEGSFDAQTAEGKAISRVLEAAERGSARCLLVAGRIRAATDRFDAALALEQLAGPEEDPLRDALHLLRRAGHRLAGAVPRA